MPSNKILEQKKAVVETLAAKLQSAQAGVLVKYEGITVAQDTELRAVYGDTVKTVSIEAVDCFLAVDPENDVQEVYSAFFVNNTPLSEADYHEVLASSCDEKDMLPLRNIEFNEPR